jgi:hypothetical protein
MAEEKRWALTEDLIDGLTHGRVARSSAAFSLQRVDDGTVLEIALGDPDRV